MNLNFSTLKIEKFKNLSIFFLRKISINIDLSFFTFLNISYLTSVFEELRYSKKEKKKYCFHFVAVDSKKKTNIFLSIFYF